SYVSRAIAAIQKPPKIDKGPSASAHSAARSAERRSGTRIAAATGVTMRTPRDAAMCQPEGKSRFTRRGLSNRVNTAPSFVDALIGRGGPQRLTMPRRLHGL